ncbi:MAG: invasin domain 3-containing protein [Planctomycetota bacterium]
MSRSLHRPILAALAASAAIAGLATAGIPLRSPTGTPLKWDLEYEQPNVIDGAITYYFKPGGTTEEPPGDVSERDAVAAGFAVWQDAPGSQVKLREDVSRWAVDTHIDDRINLISFEKFRLGPFTLAATFVNSSDGVIKDADIVFNDTSQLVKWGTTTPGTPGYTDITSVTAHEVGHLIGLDHTMAANATMSAVQPVGSIHGRTLTPDDVSALLNHYPGPPDLSSGALIGTVRIGKRKRRRGIPVFAMHAETREIAGSAVTDDDGLYRINALPPGPYRMIASPLGLPEVVSAWWSKSPQNVIAAPLAAESSSDGRRPRVVTVRPGFPTVLDDIVLKKAKRRGTGEPDDEPSRAREILLGSTTAAAFEKPLDEDWYTFTVEDTNAFDLRMRAWGLGSIADGEMALFAADGTTQLKNSIDIRPPVNPVNFHGPEGIDLDAAVINFRPPEPGTYMVRVRVQPQSESGGPEAFYYLELLPSVRVADALQTAATLVDGAVRAGTGAEASLSVTPRNVHGTPVGSGATVRVFRTDGGGGYMLDDRGDGSYTTAIPAPDLPGVTRFSISVETEAGSTVLPDVVQVFAAGPVDSVGSTLTASPRRIEADGEKTSTLILRPRDSAGRPLGPGLDIEFLFQGVPAGSLGAVSDLENGNYSVELTAPEIAGRVHVTATLEGEPIGVVRRVGFGWNMDHVLADVGGDLGETEGIPGLSKQETKAFGSAGTALDGTVLANRSGDLVAMGKWAAKAVRALEKAGGSPRFSEGFTAATELAESLRRRAADSIGAIKFAVPDAKGEKTLGKARQLLAKGELQLLLKNPGKGAKLISKALSKAKSLL